MASTFRCVCICILLSAVPLTAAAQTTVNPDISLIGDIRALSNNNPAFPQQNDRVTLDFSGLELVAGGYLNPYARADVVFSWEGEDNAEIEEAYATFMRGLPLNANLRVGQYLLEFGHLNPNHPHAYPFIHRPLPHEQFFGSEGLRDLAVRASFLLPTGNTYSELQLAVLQGGALPSAPSDSLLLEAEPEKLGFFGRLGAAVATSDYGELAFGVSSVMSKYDALQTLDAWVAGADVKYKWTPGRTTALQIESELLFNSHEMAAGNSIESWGGYAYVDYRFRQRFNMGTIGEWTEGAFQPDLTTTRAGAFVGFSPVQETSVLRLVGDWTKPEAQDGYYSVVLQLVFGLGPHQPHSF